MHEMGIVLQIIETARAAIPPQLQGIQVKALNLRIGKLTAVVPESLRFCFNIARQDTVLAGASLRIEEVPIEAACRDCGERSIIETPPFTCSRCGGGDLAILSGRELIVTSLELADP
ncbi:MAG: hydrogenase maturation nickel metallochaperone HypA [Desulfuromonadales bacterium]|nr:hydrogenase maturation nickel metallochaperone HypA [Desulfuromonadales bacterium]